MGLGWTCPDAGERGLSGTTNAGCATCANTPPANDRVCGTFMCCWRHDTKGVWCLFLCSFNMEKKGKWEVKEKKGAEVRPPHWRKGPTMNTGIAAPEKAARRRRSTHGSACWLRRQPRKRVAASGHRRCRPHRRECSG